RFCPDERYHDCPTGFCMIEKRLQCGNTCAWCCAVMYKMHFFPSGTRALKRIVREHDVGSCGCLWDAMGIESPWDHRNGPAPWESGWYEKLIAVLPACRDELRIQRAGRPLSPLAVKVCWCLGLPSVACDRMSSRWRWWWTGVRHRWRRRWETLFSTSQPHPNSVVRGKVSWRVPPTPPTAPLPPSATGTSP